MHNKKWFSGIKSLHQEDLRIFYFYFLITRCKYIFLTFTSSSRPSSCDFRSSISDSISSTDWLLCSLTNLFFTPGFILFKNPFWLLESAFNCLLASLTRMIMLSRSLIFCANCLLSSWAYQNIKYRSKCEKITMSISFILQILWFYVSSLPVSFCALVFLFPRYEHVTNLEVHLGLQLDVLRHFLVFLLNDSIFYFRLLKPKIIKQALKQI